jgi:hypothetical protein
LVAAVLKRRRKGGGGVEGVRCCRPAEESSVPWRIDDASLPYYFCFDRCRRPRTATVPWKSEVIEYRDTKPGVVCAWTPTTSTTPRSRSSSSQGP